MRYTLLLMVNAAAMMPFTFFTFAMPVILRQAGVSLELIGLANLVYLPVIFVFLWAPLIDNYCLNGLGKRRSWMAVLLGPMIALSIAMALLDPGAAPMMVLGLALLVGVLAASARTALLGYSIDGLSEEERSTGSTFLLIGSAFASLAGASGLLLVYQWSGWQSSMLTMAAFLTVAMLPVFLIREPLTKRARSKSKLAKLSAFFRRRSVGAMLFFLLWLGLSVGFSFGMLQPLLVDVGFDTEDIAAINATLTFTAILIGGPIATVVARVLGLRAALTIGLLLNAMVYLFAAAGPYIHMPQVHTVMTIGLIFFAFSFLGVMTNTLFMNFSDAGQESTDISAITSIYLLISIMGAAGSGFLASAAGYSATFLTGAACVCIAFITSRYLSVTSPASPEQSAQTAVM